MLAFLANDVVRGRGWTSEGPLDAAVVAASLIGSVAVRTAVALAFVRADVRGVEWRSWFRTHGVRWDEIESLRIGRIYLFPERHRAPILEIRETSGRIRKLRASAGCDTALGTWLVTALRLRDRIHTEEGRTRFVLSGFEREPLGGRAPDWEPGNDFATLDEATRAAAQWLVVNATGRVEVAEVHSGVGEVMAVVTADGVERT